MFIDIRRLVLGLALSIVTVAAGCAEEEPPPPTFDDVVTACLDLSRTTCERFGECLGHSAAEIAACVQREQANCPGEVEAEACWDNQRYALETCQERVEDAACPALCSDRFCFVQCPYLCPREDAATGP